MRLFKHIFGKPRILLMLPLVAVLSMSPLAASNTVILVDNSGSVAGMSSIRPHNSIRMITGELTDYLSKMEAEDTVSILRFTDRIFVSQTFAGYSDKLQSAVDSLKFVPQGNTDISSALAAVYNIETFQRVIIITDGLNNVGKSDTDICDELQSLALNVKGELYCLLLNEDDLSNAILTYADKSDNIHIIRSLSEIPPFEQVLDVAPASETVVVPANAEVEGGTFDWKWVWIVLAILLAIALIALVCWLVYKYVITALSHRSVIQGVIPALPHLSDVDYSSGTPLNSDLGNWTGERGNSDYVFNKDAKPSSKNYGNPEGKTFGEMGKDLGDPNPKVRFEKGEPVFRDPATKSGKPLEVTFDEGIDQYIDKGKVIATNGGKVDRQRLHDKAFKQLAEKYGKSVDEIKVFKGDSEPVRRLMERWGCSEKDVWDKCNNPHHIQRVLHEMKDGKTVQLVARMYHDNVAHKGGIEKVVRSILGN